MAKKLLCAFLSILLILPFGGCWSYVGLNDITIVAGMGIDFDPESKEYLLTCEIVDSSTSQQGEIHSDLVESRGATLFDAARNAKKRLISKLYVGNTQILVIGHEFAKQNGIGDVINLFISDAVCRETTEVVISQEKSAKEIFMSKGVDNRIISYQIKKILDEDQRNTASLYNVPLFRIFNTLRTPGISLTVPAFHNAQNKGAEVAEANGEAVFKDDKMVGQLTAEESKYYLFAINGVHGGLLTLASGKTELMDLTLEVSDSKTKVSYTYLDGKVKILLETDTDVFLDGIKSGTNLLDQKKIQQIESVTGKMLEERIQQVIGRVQKEDNSDIFGFGNLIYKKDPKLWTELEPKWDEIFPNLQVEVRSKVDIINSSAIMLT